MTVVGKISRVLLFVYNLILLIGIVVLGGAIGYVFLYEQDSVVPKLETIRGFLVDDIWTTLPAIIILCLGAIHVLKPFFGCFGAAAGSRWMLLTYVMLLLDSLVIMLVGGAFLYNNFKSIQSIHEVNIFNSNVTKYLGVIPSISEDTCGIISYKDYLIGDNKIIPTECCPTTDDEQVCDETRTDIYPGFIQRCKNYIYIIFGVVCGVEIVLSVLTFMVLRDTKKSKRDNDMRQEYS